MAYKISLIITIKNEKNGVSTLLGSIANQTRIPDEVVISSAGAVDLEDFAPYRNILSLSIIQLDPSANRSVGRNRAIQAARYDHILISDAGCRLKNTWVEEMITGFESAEIVAGYYEGEYENCFEKCQIPFVLIMPDRIHPNAFLPATRSMGITRRIWEKLGRFDEHFRYAEDYEFARRIKAQGVSIKFVRQAVVYWRPRKTIGAFARMIGEHAYGDGFSRTFRPKVVSIYLRYLFIILMWSVSWRIGVGGCAIYTLYSIQKNYRYVKDPRAVVYLPLLQLVSDFAVMSGTLWGLLSKVCLASIDLI